MLPQPKQHEIVKKVLNPNGKYSNIFFIPALMGDNVIGLDRDPDYVTRLEERDADLSDALKRGDWSVFAGQMFRTFNKGRHVVSWGQLMDLYPNWYQLPKWRAVDWGFTAWMVCLFFARDLDTGRIIVYREVMEKNLTDAAQARLIVQHSPANEGLSLTYGGADFFTRKSVGHLVSSASDTYAKEGVPIIRGDTDRVNGRQKVSNYLANLPDGRPGLLIVDSCTGLINILPKMAKSDKNPEDVQDMDGDDPYDCLRYGLTSVQPVTSARPRQQDIPVINESPLANLDIL